MSEPTFIGIGAQKSATSWLFKMLQEHPEVYVAEEKEVHFFSDEEKFLKGIDWYEEKFSNAKNAKAVGEISTSYLSDPKAYKRIRETYPEIKIILGLRNPIDRAISHIEHIKSKDNLSNRDFNFDGIIERFPEVLENGLYGKHLEEKYFDLFRRDQIFIFFFEEVKENPKDLVRRVYEFLDIDSSFVPKGLTDRYNAGSVRKTKTHDMMNSIYFALRKNILGKAFLKITRLLGIRAHKIVSIIDKGSDKNTESKYLRKDIYKHFEEDIKDIELLLNKDLSNWKE